ncbi:MAG: hypothetical protein OHK005_12610 [Candidatus Methylacidiphilales bacterium]
MRRGIVVGALGVAMAWAAAASEFPAQDQSRPASVQETFVELVASSRFWPSHVATLIEFDQPILRNGETVGSVKIKPGTALKLNSIKPEGVWVEVGGNRKLLPLEQTDLLARIPARKKEVEALELVQAERLRERAELPMVWPEPDPIPPRQSVFTVEDRVALAPRIRIPGYNVPGWFYYPPVYQIIYVPTPVCPYPINPIKPIQPIYPIQPCPPRYPQSSGVRIAINLR